MGSDQFSLIQYQRPSVLTLHLILSTLEQLIQLSSSNIIRLHHPRLVLKLFLLKRIHWGCDRLHFRVTGIGVSSRPVDVGIFLRGSPIGLNHCEG